MTGNRLRNTNMSGKPRQEYTISYRRSFKTMHVAARTRKKIPPSR